MLRTDSKPPSLTALGLSNAMQMELERVIARPNGLLLVSGPTGAGKSTTLYAALVDMNRPEVSTSDGQGTRSSIACHARSRSR